MPRIHRHSCQLVLVAVDDARSRWVQTTAKVVAFMLHSRARTSRVISFSQVGVTVYSRCLREANDTHGQATRQGICKACVKHNPLSTSFHLSVRRPPHPSRPAGGGRRQLLPHSELQTPSPPMSHLHTYSPTRARARRHRDRVLLARSPASYSVSPPLLFPPPHSPYIRTSPVSLALNRRLSLEPIARRRPSLSLSPSASERPRAPPSSHSSQARRRSAGTRDRPTNRPAVERQLYIVRTSEWRGVASFRFLSLLGSFLRHLRASGRSSDISFSGSNPSRRLRRRPSVRRAAPPLPPRPELEAWNRRGHRLGSARLPACQPPANH